MYALEFVEANVGTQTILRVCAGILLLIHIFERPLWSFQAPHEERWNYIDTYPSFGAAQLPVFLAKTLECFGLAGCIYGIHLQRISVNYPISLTRRGVLSYVSLPLCYVHMITLVVNFVSLSTSGKPIICVSPIEAILLFSLEQTFESPLALTVVHVMPYFLSIIAILVCIIASWAVFGMIITNRTVYESSDPYFLSFGDSLWNMLTVMNAADWPNPMIPSYSHNRAFFFFFMFYVVIVQWGMLSLILGLIINVFQFTWEETVQKTLSIKLNTKDEQIVNGDTIDVSNVLVGNDQLKQGNICDPPKKEVLASNKDDVTANINRLHASDGDESDNIETNNDDENESGTLRNKLIGIHSSGYYKAGADIFFFAIGIAFCVTDNPQVILVVQLSMKFFEILFSIYARKVNMNFLEWYKSNRNWWNLWLYVILLVASCVYFLRCSSGGANLVSNYASLNYPEDTVFSTSCKPSDLNRTMEINQNHVLIFCIILIRTVVFIRICMLVRNIGLKFFPDSVQREFNRMHFIVSETSGSLRDLIVIIFILMYIFAALGQGLFGGVITINSLTNPLQEELNDSLYGRSEYWALNFNDVPSSLFTLFTLLYVNNMQVTTSGFVAVTSKWAELYFWVWYIVGVLLCMNIFTSFVWSRIAKLLDDNVGYFDEAEFGSNDTASVEIVSTQDSAQNETMSHLSHSVRHSQYNGSPDHLQRSSVVLTPDAYPNKDIGRDSAGHWYVPQVLSPKSHNKHFIAQQDALQRQSLHHSSSIRPSEQYDNSRQSKRMVELLFEALSEPAAKESILKDSIKFHGGAVTSLFQKDQQINSLSSNSSQDVDVDSESGQSKVATNANASDMSFSYPIYNPKRTSTQGPLKPFESRDKKPKPSLLLSAISSFVPNIWQYKGGKNPVKSTKRKPNGKNRRESMKSWLKGDVDMASHERAAVLLQFARHGEVHTLFTSRMAMIYFRLRCRLAYPLLISAWLVTFIRIFEMPLWLLKCPTCDVQKYPLSIQAAFLSPAAVCVLKFPLLCLLLVGYALEIVYKVDSLKRLRVFKTSVVLRYILAAFTLMNMISVLLGATLGGSYLEFDWCLSILSVLYIFWFDRNALRKFVIVFGMVPKLFSLAIVFVTFIFIMAAGADFIFSLSFLDVGIINNIDDDYLHGGYYITFGESVWSTFVAMTSSSFPNQIIPALNAYREFSAFVIIFISCGAFVMLDVALATVNFEFQRGVSYKEAYEERASSELLESAFYMLIEESELDCREIGSKGNEGMKSSLDGLSKVEIKSPNHHVDDQQNADLAQNIDTKSLSPVLIDDLLTELYANYNDFRKNGLLNSPMRALFINILDIDGDGAINLNDFMYFLHCSRITLKRLPVDWTSIEENRKKKAEVLAQYERGSYNPQTTDFKLSYLSRMYRHAKYQRLHLSTWLLNLGRNTESNTASRFWKRIYSIHKRYWDALGDSFTGSICVLACLSQRDLRASFDDDSLSNVGLTAHRNIVISLCVFLAFEFSIKWLFLGIKMYFYDFRNKIDFAIGISMFVILIIAILLGSFTTTSPSEVQTNVLMALEVTTVMRLLLFPRNIACFANPIKGVSWDNILGTVGRIIFTFAEGFICVGFTYAQLGCLIYGGKIPNAGENPKLDHSPYGQNNFYSLNFNDMPSSFFTLFSCLRVSDFDVISSGMVTVTNHYTRVYFIFWYFVGVFLMLNIVKSYFICVFQTRKSKSKKNDVDEVLHKGVDSNPDENKSLTEEELIENEVEELEHQNLKSEFIIDLCAIAKEPEYISLESFSGPVDFEKKLSGCVGVNVLNPIVSGESPCGDERSDSMNSNEDIPRPVQVETPKYSRPWEDPLVKTKRKSRAAFSYFVNLKFERSMDPRVRLVMLRRLKYLSDLSRSSLGREYMKEDTEGLELGKDPDNENHSELKKSASCGSFEIEEPETKD